MFFCIYSPPVLHERGALIVRQRANSGHSRIFPKAWLHVRCLEIMMRVIFEVIGKVLGWLLARPTLRVRIREDRPDREIGGLEFEVENVGDKATSLNPTVTASYFSTIREPCTVIFDVRELKRNLEPFTPREFAASARESQPGRANGWFRTYTFVPTRGRKCRVRIINASLEPIGFWRFLVESLWFRATGRVDGGKTSMTMAEYDARQRSKGPH